MGDFEGFLKIEREERGTLPVKKRVKNYREFTIALGEKETQQQASRCMDCGIPYCHIGCPVNNKIPDWNNLIHDGDWQQALYNLHTTNNFPEFTGRVCPAPCETACTLYLSERPVTIKTIECAIVDKGWENGWITPVKANHQTGKKVAIIGSGPAGLACAQQLIREGHAVSVYEKQKFAGGLLMYGIPDFKLEKFRVQRRIEQMKEEGVKFIFNTNVGVDLNFKEIVQNYHAIVLAGGSEEPKQLKIDGTELNGIHFAMDYLRQQNKRISQEELLNGEAEIVATNKKVVVIGGGDTGSDCIGTANRQMASTITQLEILPIPPEKENILVSWPNWPYKLHTSTSHKEGVERKFSVMTKKFIGKAGQVKGLECIRVDENFKIEANSEFVIEADLILLAVGFIHPLHKGLLKQATVQLDNKGNVSASVRDYKTSHPKIFSAGDMRRGQSLVVWAIREGRQCAASVNKFLQN